MKRKSIFADILVTVKGSGLAMASPAISIVATMRSVFMHPLRTRRALWKSWVPERALLSLLSDSAEIDKIDNIYDLSMG